MTEMMPKDPAATRTIEADPLTVETAAAGMASDPTPLDAFYVRNNLPMPAPSGEWTVEVTGTVEEKSLTVEEIFGSHPRLEMTAVLQCAGNGRSRLAQPAEGVQWQLGGVSCGDWSGVRLADVVDGCGGVEDGVRFLNVLGGDAAADDPERVERSLPVDKALADGVLVDRLNGEPLDAVHGGPVRLLVPGYYAINSVKWPRRLAFSPAESDAAIQQQRYRFNPPGQEPTSEHPPVWEIAPTSLLISATPRAVTGVAYAGGEPIVGVDVSTDEGDTWQAAELGEDRGRFAWRRFTGPGAPAGTRVVTRARTATATQRQHTRPTAGGYAVDGWEDLSMTAD